MFSREFDIALTVIFGVITVAFFIGKGGPILDLFKGSYQAPKRSKAKQAKYERAVGYFMLELTITEAIMAIWHNMAVMGFVSAAATMVGLILLIVYVRRLDQ